MVNRPSAADEKPLPTAAPPERAAHFAHQAQQDSLSVDPDETASLGNAAESCRFDGVQAEATHSARPTLLSDRYELLEIIGRGGFAEVWRAYDRVLARTVAVKALRLDRQADEQAQLELLQEAKRLAQLELRGTVPVYDALLEGNTVYVVTKFIAGGTLAQWIAKHRPLPTEAAKVVAAVAETLHEAHLRDLIHRDIKPGNVLMEQGQSPLVADFGLAVTEHEQETEPRRVLGTLRYMSPELAAGQSHLVDGRTDIYSLGMVLYEMMTGRTAFIAESTDSLLEQITKRSPRPPRSIDPAVPTELERICLKCLGKHVESRYPTAGDFAADLHQWLGTQSLTLPRARPAASSGRPLFVAIVLAATGVAALALGIAWGVLGTRDAESASGTPLKTTAAQPPQETSRAEQPQTQLELELQAWEKRLGTRPVERIWPGYRGTSSLTYRDDVAALEVTSRAPRFFALGTIQPDTVELVSTGLGQPVWVSGCGLYFNYHDETPAGEREAHFQLIALDAGKDSAGARVLRVRAGEYRLSARDGFVYALNEWGEEVVEWPPPDTLLRLEVQIEQGTLRSIRWAGKDLPKVLANAPGKACAGEWGIAHQVGTSWFQSPRRTVADNLSERK